MSTHAQLVFGTGFTWLAAIGTVAFCLWLLWRLFWDVYDNITGRWMRIANSRSDFAQSNGQFEIPHAQRGSKGKGASLMEIWYRTGGYKLRIDRVEVERVTSAFVFIDGRQFKRQTSADCYFPTWAEARQHLIDDLKADVRAAESRLSRAKNELASAIALSPPRRIEFGAGINQFLTTGESSGN